MTTYCRFCAKYKQTSELFDLKINPEKCAEIIERLSCLNIKRVNILNDNLLPKTVCFTCDDSLHNAYSFVNKIEEAHNVLIGIFNKVEEVAITYDDKVCEFDNASPSLETSNENKHEVKLENIEVSYTVSAVKEEPEEQLDPHFINEDKIEISISEHASQSSDDVQDFLLETRESWSSFVWYCRFCPDKFPEVSLLREHSKLHHNKCMAFKCGDCEMPIDRFDAFILHVRRHREYLQNRCQYCNCLIQRGGRRTHLKSHFNSSQIACNLCGEIFNDTESFEKHMISNRKSLPKKKGRKKKDPATTEELTCQVCQKVFTSTNLRKCHERCHGDRKKEYTCERCGKAFFSRGSLLSHLNVHRENKPHVCKICNKSFLFLNRLRNHVETHTGVKKFSCDECGRWFRRSYQLNTHKKTHTDKLPFMCQFCDKSFKFLQYLKNHERLHTGAKPYSCEICETEFRNWSNCNKHMIRRHNKDMSKKKKTPEGIFPVNPETGQMFDCSEATEEWKDKLLALKIRRGGKPKKVIKENNDIST